MYACEHAFMISNIYVFMTMKNLVCRTEMADNPVDVQVFLHVCLYNSYATVTSYYNTQFYYILQRQIECESCTCIYHFE